MKMRLFAMVLACCAMVAQASEVQDRKALRAEYVTALMRGDFAAIDARYARAVATRERLASGSFVAGTMVRSLDLEPDSSSGPKGADWHWTPIEDKLRAWTASNPKSVIGAIALSRAYVSHGWAYRGSGHSNSVSKEDSARLHDYLGRAQTALLAGADAGKADPNWHWQMLRLGRLQGWPDDKYFAFAEAALDAFPYYYEIYFSIADKLLPQWGGSLEELAAFAEHAAERTKATDGRALYGRIYWSTYEMLGAERIQRGELDWPKIRAALDDLVQRYPDPWNLNFFARAACDAGDKATAVRVLGLIGDKVEPDAWDDRGHYMRCKNMAAG